MTVEAAKEAATVTAQLQQETADPEDWNALNEVGHWKAKWKIVNVADRSNTLDDTIQEISPDLYTNLILLVMFRLPQHSGHSVPWDASRIISVPRWQLRACQDLPIRMSTRRSS